MEAARSDDEHPQSAIIGEEGENLLVATRLYAVPLEAADKSHGEWLDDGESRYRISSATWEPYYSLYRVSRADYEQALGRPLRDSDFSKPAFVDEYAVSFDPADLPKYVVIEIAFLGVWFFVAAKVLLAVRRPTAALPVLVPLLLAPMFFVRVYSPAFVDADWFFQRIVVEQIALLALGVGTVLFLPALASAAVYASLRGAEQLATKAGASVPTYRRWTVAGIAGLCVLFVAVQYVRYKAEVAACLNDRGIVRARVAAGGWAETLLGASSGELPRATNLMKDEVVRDEVHEVVEKFRELQDGFRSLIDSEYLVEISQTGDYSTGFGRWLVGGHHICGETLVVEGHDVLIAVAKPFSPGLWMFR